MAEAILAIDIGGTKLAAGVVTPLGEIVSSAQSPTPNREHADTVYAALQETIQRALLSAGGGWSVASIGVGVGGPMRVREVLVSPLNIPGWRDFPIVARLRADHGLPVTLDNDAKAFALGEYLYGAGRDHSDMMGVVVSTGVGGGIVSHGRLLHGRTFNAGHVGHMVAEPDGPGCICGGRGCVEAIASGPSIARLIRSQLRQGRESILANSAPESLTARQVAEAARAGDELAREGFDRAGRALGVGFAGAAALLDIDLIVLGGGVSNAGDLLMQPLRAALAEHARLDYIRDQVEVVPTTNPQHAGLIGAAALAAQEQYHP